MGSESENHCAYIKDIERMINDRSFADLVMYASEAQRPSIESDQLSRLDVCDANDGDRSSEHCTRYKSAQLNPTERKKQERDCIRYHVVVIR